MKKTVLAVVGIVGFSGVLATQQAFAEDINVNYTSNGAITLTMLQAFNLAPKKSLPIRKIITHKFKHLKMEQQVPTMFR